MVQLAVPAVVVLLVLPVVVVQLVFPAEVIQFAAKLASRPTVVAMLRQKVTRAAVPTEWVQMAQETIVYVDRETLEVWEAALVD